MYPRAPVRTVLALAVVAAVAHASWLEGMRIRQPEEQIQVVQRDLLDGLLSGATSALGVSVSLGVGDDSTSTTSSTAKVTSSSKTTATTTTSSSTQKQTSISSTPSSTSSSATKTSSTISTPTSTTLSSVTTPASSSLIPATTEVVLQTTTVNGQILTSSYTTTSGTTTATGALQDGTTSSKSTGMSSKTKTTVIGVVVGIGGAAIAGGLFIVAWKIWGRKKNEEEGDELMSNMGREKESSSGNGSSNPFQSTLDQYHNPSRNVNASSNF